MTLLRLLPALAGLSLLALSPPARGVAPPRPHPPANPLAILLRGATVIDGRSPAPLANASVLIEGDRITRVERGPGAAAPKGAWVLDARGLFLIPGLIDMHVHATVQPAMFTYFLANGVTSVRDLGCADSRLPDLLRYRREAGQAAAPGPRLFLSGPPLDGAPRRASWFPGHTATDAASARAGVEQLADAGVDCIKLYRGLSVPVGQAAVEAAHARGLKTTWDYRWSHRYLFDAALTGVDGLEHVFYSERASRDEVDQLATVIGERKIWFDPTLVAFRPPDTDVTHDPDFARLPASMTRFWRGLFWPMETEEEFRVMQAFVRKVRERGGWLLAGTDTPVKYCAPGFSLHHELRLLTTCGLTPREALQAATRSAAEALGHPELGVIAPGKQADLLLLAANPLKEIGATRRIAWVFSRGRPLDPAELLARAAREGAAAPAFLPGPPPEHDREEP